MCFTVMTIPPLSCPELASSSDSILVDSLVLEGHVDGAGQFARLGRPAFELAEDALFYSLFDLGV